MEDRHSPLTAEGDARMPDSVRTSSLVPYLRLTRELAGVLTPIKPRDEFREQLRSGLLAAARQQQAQRLLFRSDLPASLERSTSGEAADTHPMARPRGPSELPTSWRFRVRRGESPLRVDVPPMTVATLVQSERSGHRWVWGAAALGSAAVSLSLVGVVAYVVRHRHREAA